MMLDWLDDQLKTDIYYVSTTFARAQALLERMKTEDPKSGSAVFNANEFTCDFDKEMELSLEVDASEQGYRSFYIPRLTLKRGDVYRQTLTLLTGPEAQAAQAAGTAGSWDFKPYVYACAFNGYDISRQDKSTVISKVNDAQISFELVLLHPEGAEPQPPVLHCFIEVKDGHLARVEEKTFAPTASERVNSSLTKYTYTNTWKRDLSPEISKDQRPFFVLPATGALNIMLTMMFGQPLHAAVYAEIIISVGFEIFWIKYSRAVSDIPKWKIWSNYNLDDPQNPNKKAFALFTALADAPETDKAALTPLEPERYPSLAPQAKKVLDNVSDAHTGIRVATSQGHAFAFYLADVYSETAGKRYRRVCWINLETGQSGSAQPILEAPYISSGRQYQRGWDAFDCDDYGFDVRSDGEYIFLMACSSDDWSAGSVNAYGAPKTSQHYIMRLAADGGALTGTTLHTADYGNDQTVALPYILDGSGANYSANPQICMVSGRNGDFVLAGAVDFSDINGAREGRYDLRLRLANVSTYTNWMGAVALASRRPELFAAASSGGAPFEAGKTGATLADYGIEKLVYEWDENAGKLVLRQPAEALYAAQIEAPEPVDIDCDVHDIDVGHRVWVDYYGEEMLDIIINNYHTTREAVELNCAVSAGKTTTITLPLKTFIPDADQHREARVVISARNVAETATVNNEFTLYLGKAPLIIVQHPRSVTVPVGGTATFTVGVTGGAPPYKYRWQVFLGGKWKNIPGANAATLTLSKVKLKWNGRQTRCVVTDAAGATVTSDAATLTVTRLPNTGDPTRLPLYLAVALIAAALLLLLRRRARGRA